MDTRKQRWSEISKAVQVRADNEQITPLHLIDCQCHLNESVVYDKLIISAGLMQELSE